MARYDRAHTFFYPYPPYRQTEGYGVPYTFEEYQAQAKAMRTCKGKMMVSINTRICCERSKQPGFDFGDA